MVISSAMAVEPGNSTAGISWITAKLRNNFKILVTLYCDDFNGRLSSHGYVHLRFVGWSNLSNYVELLGNLSG